MSTINERAEDFSNIQVYASSPWFRSQPGKMRRLRIESDLVEENSVPLVSGLATTLVAATCAVLVVLAVALLLFKIWRTKKFGDPFPGFHLRQTGTVRFCSS